jgi:transposase
MECTVIERVFNRIKHFRCIAARCQKTALAFAAMLFVVAAVICLQ